MHIALLSDLFPGRPAGEVAAATASAGFGNLELNASRRARPHIDYRSPDASRLAVEWRRACDAQGIAVVAVAAFENLASLDGEERRAAVAYCRRAIASFGVLGCSRLTCMVSGSNLLPAPPQWIALRASLDELAESAAAVDATIALEIYPGNFLEHTSDVLEFLTALAAPHVGYLLCVAHLAAIGEDIVRAYEHSMASLLHVHLSDTPVGTPLHRHLELGLGQAEWRRLCLRLTRDQFAGTLTLQLYSHADEFAPTAYARRSLAALDAVFAN